MRVIHGLLPILIASALVSLAFGPLSAQNNETPRNTRAWCTYRNLLFMAWSEMRVPEVFRSASGGLVSG